MGDSTISELITGVDIALARYNPDGSPDETFGSGGKVLTDFGKPDQSDRNEDYGYGLALLPGGRFIVAGTYRFFAGFTNY